MAWLRKKTGWLFRHAQEVLGDFITAKGLFEAMGGFFADEEQDHKCGVCWMRIPSGEGDRADCTVVNVSGGISLGKGTCNFWDPGEPSKLEDRSQNRASIAEAGYIESPTADYPIWCGTCPKHYRELDENSGNCLFLMGRVKHKQCCVAYSNPEVKAPNPHTESTKQFHGNLKAKLGQS